MADRHDRLIDLDHPDSRNTLKHLRAAMREHAEHPETHPDIRHHILQQMEMDDLNLIIACLSMKLMFHQKRGAVMSPEDLRQFALNVIEARTPPPPGAVIH